MSVIKTFTHRGVDYNYNEWTTWNGKPASGYTITNHPTFEWIKKQIKPD